MVEGFYFSDDDDLQVQQESAATKDPFFEKEDVFTLEMNAFLEQHQVQLATFQAKSDKPIVLR